MTSRVQTHRSSVTNQRPGNNTRTVGENFVNFADKAAGYIDPDGVARDYIAVRFFSTTANYAIGAHVINAGVLYRAIAAVTAGAFNPSQWTSGLAQADGDARYVKATDAETLYVNSAGDVMTGALTLSGNPSNALHASPKQYTDTKLPLAGGTMTGPIILPGTPSATNEAANKDYVDAQVSTRIHRAGDTMSGPLVVVTPPTANNHAASKGYVDGLVGPLSSGKVDEAPNDGNQYGRQSLAWSKVTGGALVSDTPPPTASSNSFWWNSSTGALFIKYDDGNSQQFVQCNQSGAFLPTSGGTLSGDLMISKASPAFFLNKSASGGQNLIYGRTNGLARWVVEVGSATAESGSNVGSDFAISSFTDAGGYLTSPLIINRATGVVTATGLPPTPTTAATVGQWKSFASAYGGAAVLPAGGTWSFIVIGNTSAGVLHSQGIIGGVAAGGATIAGAVASIQWTGFYWRIA